MSPEPSYKPSYINQENGHLRPLWTATIAGTSLGDQLTRDLHWLAPVVIVHDLQPSAPVPLRMIEVV